jgi:hypothetical protein
VIYPSLISVEKNLPLNSFYAHRSVWLKSKRTNTNLKSSAFSKVTVAEKFKFSTTAITLSIGKQAYPFQVQQTWFG